MKTFALMIALALIGPTAAMGMGFTDEAQAPQKGVVGQAFRFQLSGKAGSPPYHFKIDSGQLPPGLTMSEQGLIQGHPTEAGMYKAWFNLADSGTTVKHSQRQLTITIDTVPPPADWEKPGWKLTFFEEFTNKRLDAGRWIPNYQGDVSMPGNIFVKDGVLHVRMDRDNPPSPPDKPPIPTIMRPDNKGRVSSYESQGFLMQKYGWFEVRARMPGGPGVRSAIWMSPRIAYEKLKSDGGTRDNENEAIEIDLYDQSSKDQKTARCAVHYGRDAGAGQKIDQKQIELPPNASDYFRIYALEWNENALIWYIDGKEVFRSDKVPHAEMFMRFSVFEDESAGEAVTYPKDMEVDYVRWYEKEDEGSSSK